MLAAFGILVVPWVLRALYGATYRAAGITVAIALAVAVVHMGTLLRQRGSASSPFGRLASSTRYGAVFVATAGTLLMFHHGTAWEAMGIYFGAHVLSAFLILVTLKRLDHVPPGLWQLFLTSTCGSTLLAALALYREFSQSKPCPRP